MKKTKKLIFLLILCLLILSCNFSVASETNYDLYSDDSEIQDLNQKIKNNQNKIENLKKATEEYAQKIEEYRDKAASLKNQISLLDNQILKLELDIKTTQLQIDKIKLEIESMEFQIDKEEKDIELQKNNLIEYIKLIDQTDQKSYLEILILNNSFAEFFNQLNYLEEIQNNIKNSVDRLKLLKEAIEVQRADKVTRQEELEELKQEQEAQEEKLKQENKAKEILLLETKSSEIQFERLLVETRQRQEAIGTDIVDIKHKIEDRIERLRSGSTSPKTTLLSWPIPAPHTVTAYFHDPDYPYRYIFEHPAIDLRASQGTAITAPAPGYVARIKDAGYGYSYIILIHDNNISTVYGHVSAMYVTEDTFVDTGDVIGLTGGMPGTLGAGNLSTGPHLHFEVRLNGIPVNPLEYLP
ncbi:MAG: peptidoglycan DD-metalloendopeptidase family protein [Candidatus Buchananbacteria bacterium]|nr:peptidoglycan DD-metalloendopeptidase family protein [Candidatus Buchananbacteria bacterium]